MVGIRSVNAAKEAECIEVKSNLRKIKTVCELNVRNRVLVYWKIPINELKQRKKLENSCPSKKTKKKEEQKQNQDNQK
jgi:hypothetical protein